ncbi:MAG TPA: hypothetical protein VFS97_14205 [Nitrososphaeraceae archaeon]|jgi:Tol biopolymer transport system component|nr:hypothetical protein [Nitrososphaeraceae archaeon]
MNSDGTGQTRINAEKGYSEPSNTPTCSPDGTKIAFTSNRDVNWEIYVMNAQDGSNQTNLTIDPASDALAEWTHSAR